MSRPPPRLEEPYRGAALRPGSVRYLAWLFAAAPMREPLLGTFALLGEWQALAHPRSEPTVAHLKLGWWQEEIERLGAGRPVHPITRFLAALPGAGRADFGALGRTLAAVHEELMDTPLESAADFGRRALALRAVPLRLAAGLADAAPASDRAADEALDRALAALADGAQVGAALASWRRRARPEGGGRPDLPVKRSAPFALAELRAAGVACDDLALDPPPAALREYLVQAREHAARRLATVAATLPVTLRAGQRHLAVLAALERKRLYAGGEAAAGRTAPVGSRSAFGDLWSAWRAARRAVR